MKILKKLKGLFFDKEPKPLSVLEKAKTRGGFIHCIVNIDLDLGRRVSTMVGWAEDKDGKREIVSWSATGLAFVANKRTRQFDLIIKETYESIC